MTCGRTDHTKFASAPIEDDGDYYSEEADDIAKSDARKAAISPLTNVPAGTYDNRTTMCRERWAWNRLSKQTELCHQVSAEALSEPDSLGIAWPKWGHYPDLPKGEALGGKVQVFEDRITDPAAIRAAFERDDSC